MKTLTNVLSFVLSKSYNSSDHHFDMNLEAKVQSIFF